MTLWWSTEVHNGDWLVGRIDPSAGNVGSVAPHGFEAYVRVFHPVEEGLRRRSGLAHDVRKGPIGSALEMGSA